MWEICKAVFVGYCPQDLANRDPGTLSHSRWLTFADRLLRLYVGTAYPTPQPVSLATFVMKVYAPSWFTIKYNSTFRDGPRNLQLFISRFQYLPDNLMDIVKSVVQDNAYFAHAEDVLAAMLFDDRSYVRQLSIRRIMKARKSGEQTNDIRKFRNSKAEFPEE